MIPQRFTILKHWALSALLALCLAACGGENRPDDLLSEEEMVPVLRDMQIAYAGVDNTIRNPKQRTQRYEEMNQLVMKKNGVDREKFRRSYDYYKMQPAIMDSIFQRVIIALNDEMKLVQQGKIKSEHKEASSPSAFPRANIKGTIVKPNPPAKPK